MAMQKFPTYLKTDPVLLTLCSPVIVELIMPMKYISFFPKKGNMKKGTKESLSISKENPFKIKHQE